MKKHRNVLRRAGGLVLLAFWLSLHAISFAQGQKAQAPLPAVTQAPNADVRYAVDFSYLQAVAPNAVAWLYQPDTVINQPVMFCDRPGYYLRRQFNDRISSNGSIFMTGGERPDFSLPVITLYGANCLDFSMFGSLSNYRESEYYEKNPTLYLLTPGGDYQLAIFAGIRTRLSDQDAWRVSPKPTAALWAEDLPGILAKSFLTPKPSCMPEPGDAWAVLATESQEKQGFRYVLYARKRPMDGQAPRVAYVNQLPMDCRATLNGPVSVENVGEWMVYAQNDPLWKRLVFEVQTSSRRRPFGDGGCGPTAVAMAIANLVEKEELGKLGAFAASPFGFRFCTCSVNDYWCSGKHLTYQLTTPQEYLRYLPLAVASFATGNNRWGVQGRADRFGTSMRYLEDLCRIFDISVTQTDQLPQALAFLQKEDTLAIACTSGYGSPFTKGSHFLVLAGVDEDYLYVLDPYRREDYQGLDRKNLLEVMAPGLVRIKLEEAAQCQLGPIYQLHRAAAPFKIGRKECRFVKHIGQDVVGSCEELLWERANAKDAWGCCCFDFGAQLAGHQNR